MSFSAGMSATFILYKLKLCALIGLQCFWTITCVGQKRTHTCRWPDSWLGGSSGISYTPIGSYPESAVLNVRQNPSAWVDISICQPSCTTGTPHARLYLRCCMMRLPVPVSPIGFAPMIECG